MTATNFAPAPTARRTAHAERRRGGRPDAVGMGMTATSAEALAKAARLTPLSPALVWANPEGEEHHFTCSALYEWATRTANALSHNGVGKGDTVLVALGNRYQRYFCMLAAEMLGARMVCELGPSLEQALVGRSAAPRRTRSRRHRRGPMVSFDEAVARAAKRLRELGAKAVVCDSESALADLVSACGEAAPTLKKRFLVNTAGSGTAGAAAARAMGYGQELSGTGGVCAPSCARRGWLDFNACVRASSPVPEDWQRHAEGTAGEGTSAFGTGAFTAPRRRSLVCVMDASDAPSLTARLWGDGGCALVYDSSFKDADEVLDALRRFHATAVCCPPGKRAALERAYKENVAFARQERTRAVA